MVTQKTKERTYLGQNITGVVKFLIILQTKQFLMTKDKFNLCAGSINIRETFSSVLVYLYEILNRHTKTV